MKTFALLEDFMPNFTDFSDHKKNWEAFCKAQDTGLPIYVTSDVKLDGWQHKTKHDLVITGYNDKVSSLTFLKKVSKKQGTFVSDNSERGEHVKGVKYAGISIDISNVKLVSSHYHNYKDDYFNDKYKPSSPQYLYKEKEGKTVVDVEKVSIKNCTILGNIAINYEPTNSMAFLHEYPNKKIGTDFGIQKVVFANNNLQYTDDVLTVDAFANETYIGNNILENCVGVAVKTNFCNRVTAIGNTFENDFILQPHMLKSGTHYCCLVQVVGGTLFGRNNSFKNLLGVGPALEIYPFYVSGMGNIDWENNPQDNVAFVATEVRQLSCMLKIKNAVNVNFRHNVCKTSEAAFESIGMTGEQLSSIVASSGVQVDNTVCNISDNHFELPYINELSKVYNTNHFINNNTFVIGKIYNDTLFEDKGADRGLLEFNGNTFRIGEVVGGVLNLFSTIGTTTQRVLFNDSRFFFEKPCTVTFGGDYKTDNVNYGLNTSIFESSGNEIENGTITNGLFNNFNSVGYPFTNAFESEFSIDGNYSNSENYIKTLEGMGSSAVKVLNNKSNEMGLIIMRDKDFTYKVANPFFNHNSILMYVQVLVDDLELSYELDLKGMNELNFGNQSVKAIDRKENTVSIIQSKQETDVLLTHETKGKMSYIGLKNICNKKQFEVKVGMEVKNKS